MMRGYLFSGVLHATLVAVLLFGVTGPAALPPAAGPAVTVELVTLAETPEPPAPEPAATSPRPPRQAASPPPPRPAPPPEPEPEPEPPQQAQQPPPEPAPIPQAEPEPAPRPEPVAQPTPPAPMPEPVAPPEPEPAPEPAQVAALPPEPRPSASERTSTPPAPRPALRPTPPPAPEPEPEPAPRAAPEPPRPAQPPPPPRPARAEPQPAAEPEPREDRLAALLRSVEEVHRRVQDETERPGEGRAPPRDQTGQARALEGQTAAMSAGEIDALKRQIEGCWTIPRAVPGIEDMVVRLRISLQPDRRVRDVRIEDQARTAADPGYRAVAESAQRAVLTCSPLRVPPEKYQLWRELLLTFHLRDVLGG